MELLYILNELKARINGGLSASDKRFIKVHYYLITGKHFTKTACNDCYRDAFIEMYNLYKKTNKLMSTETNFKLLNGVVLQTPGTTSVATSRSITNKIAIEHLAADPGKIHLFASFPDNWKKLVNDYKKRVKK